MERNLTQEIVFRITAVDNSDADDIMDLFCDEIRSGQITVELDSHGFQYRVAIYLSDFSRVTFVKSKILEYCTQYEKNNKTF